MPMLEIDTTYADFPNDSTYHTLWTGSITTKDVKIQGANLTCCSIPSFLLEFRYNGVSTVSYNMFTNYYHYEDISACTTLTTGTLTVNRIRIRAISNTTLSYCQASERVRIKLCLEMFNHPSSDGTCPTSSDDRYSRVDLTLSYA